MEQFTEGESTREEIKNKLRQNFDGKIVRKDLTKKIKEGVNSTSFVDFASVPADLMSAFQLIPYQSAEDAVFKALGVE